MEKYQERPHEQRDKSHNATKNSCSQIDKSAAGDLTSRPKSTLDKYQARNSSTYRERSISNARGSAPKQLAQTNARLVKMIQNSTTSFSNIGHRAVEQL